MPKSQKTNWRDLLLSLLLLVVLSIGMYIAFTSMPSQMGPTPNYFATPMSKPSSR